MNHGVSMCYCTCFRSAEILKHDCARLCILLLAPPNDVITLGFDFNTISHSSGIQHILRILKNGVINTAESCPKTVIHTVVQLCRTVIWYLANCSARMTSCVFAFKKSHECLKLYRVFAECSKSYEINFYSHYSHKVVSFIETLRPQSRT